MNQLRFYLLVLLVMASFSGQAQDVNFVKQTVKTLASPKMQGRGYVRNGDRKAAEYLAAEMKKAGLKSFGKDYFQSYSFNINTFPGKVNLSVDGQELVPGIDFVVYPSMAPVDAQYQLMFLPDTITQLESVYQLIDTNQLTNKLVVVPEGLANAYRKGIPGVSAVAQTVSGSMWWHVSRADKQEKMVRLKIRKNALSESAQMCHLKVEASIQQHEAVNLIGYVPGAVVADSFFVMTAHYDHLGRMGKRTYFPGASDNASGTAAVLDFARYYVKNPGRYSMVFILVSGEEAGLLGSKFNAENPLFPLENVRFLINFDMVGTGSEGLSVVNGKQFLLQANCLDSLNRQGQYFADIRLGGESCNSDHCPYYQKGVPAFFMFTRGSENKEYHTITDTEEKLPFTAYESLFGLIRQFVEASSSQKFDR